MAEERGLAIERLSVNFGGVMAVDEASLAAPMGQVTALIGPNGAGKTTTFNAVTGLVRPTHGSVRLHGTDITGSPPHERAQLGLGRTFQRMELFDSLSVRGNVALGREARFAAARPLRHLRGGAEERAQVHEAAERSIERCGLGDIADLPVARLSTGQRRLVELARVVAADFSMLLLDEPSSGLDQRETARFGEVLLDLVADEGVGILLVEHDMNLVMSVCEQIHVLDFGRLIFAGDPAGAQASAVVREAYLGVA